jgi:hypothetical protein
VLGEILLRLFLVLRGAQVTNQQDEHDETGQHGT